jgi:hypothetical protein
VNAYQSRYAADNKKGSQGCLSLHFFAGELTALEETAELLVELVNATGGIDDLLLTGIERMAVRAYFNVEVVFAHRGFSHKNHAARAGHFNVGIRWMDILFHCESFFKSGTGVLPVLLNETVNYPPIVAT